MKWLVSMPLADPTRWSNLMRGTLQRYDETLLRQVAAKLVRPRSQWPVEELIDRCLETMDNPTVIDRRLRELEPASRQLLALLDHSRQMRWRLGNLVELLMALGHADGLKPIFALLEAGLLFPDLCISATGQALVPRLKSFEQWLGLAASGPLTVFTVPLLATRAREENLGLPECPTTAAAGAIHEADGLEWPLRLAALWQQVAATPLRRTQQGDFFKRDFDRLRQDPLLSAPSAEGLAEVPDPGLLAAALEEIEGIIHNVDGEWCAAVLPEAWDRGLPSAIESLFAALPWLENWNAQEGGRFGSETAGNPFPSAYLLALLLLSRLPPDAWTHPCDVEEWIMSHHPFWAGEGTRPSHYKRWMEAFLLGLAYQWRLVQGAKDTVGEWVVRLSPLGRWLLGLAETPSMEAAYPRTLLVQPNLEIIAYRQGLTPALISRLTKIASWRTLGAACTLQLGPESVYRGLESGLTFESILQTLEQHGTRPTPAPVIESLRTWSNKRERITVYPAAALLEFGSAVELDEALARGLPGVRVTDRLAVVAKEDAIDYRHFRLTGTRDYSLPPDPCVQVEADGVTLTIDLSRSDLLLETLLPRFAQLVDHAPVPGRRQYRLTPASLTAGRESGLTLPALESWFQQRTGGPLSPAARLLMTASQAPSPHLQRHLILHVASEDLADGLLQWPETRSLIEDRPGPTTLIIAEENADALQERLSSLGMPIA